jgi:tetratricopeptide (TPR) repeat protein
MEAGDPGQIVSALTALGMIACFGGRAAEGVRHLEEAAGFRGTDRRQEADARNALGQNLIDLQRFGEAESQLLAALALYGELEDRRGQAEVLGMLGTLRMERGEPEAAESDFRKAIETSKAIGYRHGEAVYEMNLAILYVITNRLGSALESFEAAAHTYGLMGNKRGRALVQSNAAWLWHGLIGDDRKARELVELAVDIYREIGDVRGEAQCLALLGSIAGRSGRHTEADALFEDCLELTRGASDSWLTAQALREYASYQMEAGDHSPALKNAIEAEQLCREFGMNDLLVGIRALIGRIYLRLGELDQAEESAGRAMREIRPGVELAHLVPLALSEVAEARGDQEAAGRLIDMAHKQLMETLSGLPSQVQAQSLESVPSHRAITEAWRRRQPEIGVFFLSSVETPAGRSLTEADLAPVEWTIHDPSDGQIADRLERRRRRIVRLLNEAERQNASPTVEDLAGALGSSSATIRRDLAALRAAGIVVNTRGSR